MAKRCGFCEFVTEDEAAFAQHLRDVHQWGVAPPSPPAGPVPIPYPNTADAGVAKFCGNCGAPRDSAATNFCRNCGTPYAATGPTAAAQASPAFAEKGGFWRRTGAYILDSLVVGVIAIFLGLIVGGFAAAAEIDESDVDLIAQSAGQLLSLAYFLYFWSSRGEGQTPGMRALGMRVIRTDGTTMTIGRAFLRYLGFVLSALALLIGLIWVAFDKNKQGWHDKIADTYVIRV